MVGDREVALELRSMAKAYAELADCKAILASLSKLPAESSAKQHAERIIPMLARWANEMERRL